MGVMKIKIKSKTGSGRRLTMTLSMVVYIIVYLTLEYWNTNFLPCSSTLFVNLLLGNEESAGAEEAKASTETPKSSEPGSPQKGILKQSPTSKPSSPEKEMSKPGSPEEATSKPGSPEKETTAGDTGQAGETSGNQGGSEANAEVGKDGNTADSTEFTSKRVGKESKEKFTLTKTGKMKKTKDNSDEKRENKET